jgi:methionyl-tRNA synthetase
MQNEELEEKVTMMEELIQGFVTRMNVVETEMPEFLKTFLQQYKETLDRIAARIEIANKRYDDAKIRQQIDEVKEMVTKVPKVIDVKNSHHFGAWSKSLIIGIVVCFVVTASSVGTSLYLNHQNDRLNS